MRHALLSILFCKRCPVCDNNVKVTELHVVISICLPFKAVDISDLGLCDA